MSEPLVDTVFVQRLKQQVIIAIIHVNTDNGSDAVALANLR
jgi:hypothetical protein